MTATAQPDPEPPVEALSRSPTIYIPHSERGRAVSEVPLSVRLRNVLQAAEIRVLGDLHGRTYEAIGRIRNCGKRTVSELALLVSQMLCGTVMPQTADDMQPVRMESHRLNVPPSARALSLAEIPVSVRLENILRQRGITTLGELHGVDLNELRAERNCGKKSITELRQLADRAGNGEFDTAKAGSAPLETVVCVNAGIAKIGSRDRKIVAARFGAYGVMPKTLEEIGAPFRLTRERIRQIARDTLKAIRRTGGRKFISRTGRSRTAAGGVGLSADSGGVCAMVEWRCDVL